jgi:hypothetical protein
MLIEITSKNNPIAISCFYLGLSTKEEGCCFYNIYTKKIFISMNFIINEKCYPSRNLFPYIYDNCLDIISNHTHTTRLLSDNLNIPLCPSHYDIFSVNDADNAKKSEMKDEDLMNVDDEAFVMNVSKEHLTLFDSHILSNVGFADFPALQLLATPVKNSPSLSILVTTASSPTSFESTTPQVSDLECTVIKLIDGVISDDGEVNGDGASLNVGEVIDVDGFAMDGDGGDTTCNSDTCNDDYSKYFNTNDNVNNDGANDCENKNGDNVWNYQVKWSIEGASSDDLSFPSVRCSLTTLIPSHQNVHNNDADVGLSFFQQGFYVPSPVPVHYDNKSAKHLAYSPIILFNMNKSNTLTLSTCTCITKLVNLFWMKQLFSLMSNQKKNPADVLTKATSASIFKFPVPAVYGNFKYM